ncbi:MAG: hypothetical protein U0904_04005 [Candidatus Nanopelagicales bacterium]|nr:hypothetical protein [Candidatus Nanopelagicales bacterium]
MAPLARYLVDNSALNRIQRQPAVRDRLQPLIDKGLVGVCQVTVLEGCAPAPSPGDYLRLQAYYSQFEMLDTTPAALDLALELQLRLARQSQHHNVPLPDLIMAGTAIRCGVVMLHYDADFDKTAQVDDRLVSEWVVPRGSVP